MHILIAGLYGCTIWTSALAYTLIAGGPFWLIAACFPFIISGSMGVIWALEYAVCKLHTTVKSYVRA